MQKKEINPQVVTVTVVDLLLVGVLFYIIGGWTLVGIVELIAVIGLALGVLIKSFVSQGISKPAVAKVQTHRHH